MNPKYKGKNLLKIKNMVSNDISSVVTIYRYKNMQYISLYFSVTKKNPKVKRKSKIGHL